MSRDLTAGMVTEITGTQLKPALLLYLDFPSGAVRFWEGIGDLSWDSQTWTGAGSMGSVDFATESTGVQAHGAVFSLSGIDPSLIALALGDKVRGREAVLYLAALDGAGAVIADPVEIFSGRMDHMTITESEDAASINVHCESYLIDISRASEWRYSHEHQRQLFPGDVGFEFAATTVDQDIHWNQKNIEKTIPVSTGDTRKPNPWRP